MDLAPWAALGLQGQEYLIKAHFDHACCAIRITDMVTVWAESLCTKAMEARNKAMNPHANMPLDRTVKMLKDSLAESPSPRLSKVLFRKSPSRIKNLPFFLHMHLI